ncbi:32158_t:CDS:2, partial [Racocetra persica]
IAATIKLDELCQKILDITVLIGLKDEDNKNDIATADEIKEFYILEKNEYNNILIKTLDSVVISEVIKDNIEENYSNREFDINAL